MKQDKLKDLQTLAKEHKKIKAAILTMCDELDSSSDVKRKEIIKTAIDNSVLQLNEIENQYKQLLSKF